MIKRQFAPATSEAAVASFETMLGLRLPHDYREFLLKFNGGEPSRPVFRPLGVDGSYTDSAVRYFFSISEASTFSLAHKHSIYPGAGRTPKEMLPIAADAGGNLVLLALAGEDAGKVFFWNHEIETIVENPASPEHLNLIAKSFQEFCDRLLPFS